MEQRCDDSIDVSQLICKALQQIPYWIGYKHASFWQHKLPEGAIVAELREALLARCGHEQSVACEVGYSELGFKSAQTHGGRPIQADLVITEKGNRMQLGTPLAVIEVKRGHILDDAAREDLVYLKKLRQDTAGRFRTFLVLVTESGRPKDGLTERGTADRKFEIEGFPGVRVRRVLRAIGHAAEQEDSTWGSVATCKQQHWVVLYEVE